MSAGEAQAVATRPLPRGPHHLAREQVVASQRERMLAAIAQAVAEKGYAATTVGDVVARAGVSRKTFYEHFDDKEECFTAAWDSRVEALLDAIGASSADAGDPAGRMRMGVRAYLGALADEPAFARSFLIEVVAAGPRAEARRSRVHGRFADLFAALHEQSRREDPQLPAVPATVCRAAVGAINEVVSDHVRAGRAADLLELEDEIVYLVLVLFAGHDAAAAATGG